MLIFIWPVRTGRAGVALARLPEAALPTAVAAAQEGPAAARKQAAPVPEALVGAAAQPAERRPTGTLPHGTGVLWPERHQRQHNCI